jgi:hypothetical protein
MGQKNSQRTRSLLRWLSFGALCVLVGACASPQVVVETDPGQVATLDQARGYLRNADKAIEDKKQSVVQVQQFARAGTVIGTIGLGAAALANLHKDAAIGFAALAAISSQGLPLAAPAVWYGNCTEAQAALTCIDGVADKLHARMRDLKRGADDAYAVDSRVKNELKGAPSPGKGLALNRELAAMQAAARKALAEVAKEPEVANALYKSAKGVVRDLNGLLWANQPSIGAFQIAASSIVTSATSAGTSSQPRTPAPTGFTQPPAGSARAPSSGPTQADLDAIADDLIANASAVRGDLDRATQTSLGDQIILGSATSECRGRLVGAVLPITVNEAAKSEITLGNGVETTVVASGGTGLYVGTWVGASPGAGLIEPPSLPSSGTFKFKQLKKEATEQKFTYRIWDAADQSRQVEVKIKIPAQP